MTRQKYYYWTGVLPQCVQLCSAVNKYGVDDDGDDDVIDISPTFPLIF